MVNNIAVLYKFRKRKDEVPTGTTVEDYLHHEWDFTVTLDMRFKGSSGVVDAGKHVETANCQIDMVADTRDALYGRFFDLIGKALMSIRMAFQSPLRSSVPGLSGQPLSFPPQMRTLPNPSQVAKDFAPIQSNFHLHRPNLRLVLEHTPSSHPHFFTLRQDRQGLA
jgi:hypothetical protein